MIGMSHKNKMYETIIQAYKSVERKDSFREFLSSSAIAEMTLNQDEGRLWVDLIYLGGNVVDEKELTIPKTGNNFVKSVREIWNIQSNLCN